MSGEALEPTNPKFGVKRRPDGIVQLTWAPGVVIGQRDAVDATEAIAGLAAGKKALALIIPGVGVTQDRSARLEFARRDDLVTAAAVVVHTPTLRIMGNFFINVNRPRTRIRVFDDEAAAVDWLHSFHAQTRSRAEVRRVTCHGIAIDGTLDSTHRGRSDE